MGKVMRVDVSIGQKFGRLTVTKENGIVEQCEKRYRSFLCDCSCGTKDIPVIGSRLVRKIGGKRSCGCLNRDISTKHGLSRGVSAETFRSWSSLIQRCTNPNNVGYHKYGAIGIKPCKGISDGPEMFIKIMGLRPSHNLTVDRYPDNAGGYWCGECEECLANGRKLNIRWATISEQNRNLTNRIRYEAFGKKQLIVEWAEEYKINRHMLWCRINRYGMTMEEALTRPLHDGRYEAFGRIQLIQEWAKEYDMSKSTLTQRIADGMTMEEALLKPLSKQGRRKNKVQITNT